MIKNENRHEQDVQQEAVSRNTSPILCLAALNPNTAIDARSYEMQYFTYRLQVWRHEYLFWTDLGLVLLSKVLGHGLRKLSGFSMAIQGFCPVFCIWMRSQGLIVWDERVQDLISGGEY